MNFVCSHSSLRLISDGNKRQKEDIRNDKIGRKPNTDSFRFLNAIIRRVVEFFFFFEQTVSSEFRVVENKRVEEKRRYEREREKNRRSIVETRANRKQCYCQITLAFIARVADPTTRICSLALSFLMELTTRGNDRYVRSTPIVVFSCDRHVCHSVSTDFPTLRFSVHSQRYDPWCNRCKFGENGNSIRAGELVSLDATA